MKVDGARVDIAFMPLDELVRRAYRIRPDQLDGPVWMRDQHFDVLANIPEAFPRIRSPKCFGRCWWNASSSPRIAKCVSSQSMSFAWIRAGRN
jgi:hypothetical protein